MVFLLREFLNMDKVDPQTQQKINMFSLLKQGAHPIYFGLHDHQNLKRLILSVVNKGGEQNALRSCLERVSSYHLL